MRADMTFKEFWYLNKPMYIILEIDEGRLTKDLKSIQEGLWKGSAVKDYFYRIDPARPELKQQRHVHIAHKKHTSSPSKQVSWNEDKSRHDRHNFDTNFHGIEAAKQIAISSLGLPIDSILEHDLSMATRPALFESIQIPNQDPVYLLSVKRMGAIFG